MGVRFTNNAAGTLSAGITNVATSAVLSAGQGALFPTLVTGQYFYASLIDTSGNIEIVKVTARSTDTLTIVRAQEGTTARAFATLDKVEHRVTAAGLNEKADASLGMQMVTTIAVMRGLTPSTITDKQTIRCTGYANVGDGGGGDFYWDATSTATVDGGTCFQAAAGGTGRFFRIVEGDVVNVLWFGADASGSVDATAACQAAYNFAATTNFGVGTKQLFFPSGYYNVNLVANSPFVDIIGASTGAQLRSPAANPTGTVIYCNWTGSAPFFTKIANLSVYGSGAYQNICIDAGIQNFIQIKDVLFDGSPDICVKRGGGNFCFTIENCTFESSNYHVYSTDTAGHTAHAGDYTHSRGHMRGAQKAVFYFDSITGQSGKVHIDHPTIEGNPGYVYFIKQMNTGGASTVQLAPQHNEGNATGGSITVGGITDTPVWAYIGNTNAVRITDVAFGALRIVNSTVITEHCDLTYSGDSGGGSIDNASVLIHDNARYSNYVNMPVFPGLVRSLTNIVEGSFGTGSWVNMSPLQSVITVPGATTHLRVDGTANVAFSSITTTTQTDTAIPTLTSCQDLVFPTGSTQDSPSSGATNIAAGRFICWVLVSKMTNGTATVRMGTTGSIGSVARPLTNTGFEVTKGMVVSPVGGSAFLGFRFVASAAATVRIGGYAIVSFATRREAMNFLNSAVFPA